jgi:hypothetical protein
MDCDGADCDGIDCDSAGQAQQALYCCAVRLLLRAIPRSSYQGMTYHSLFLLRQYRL